MPVMTVGTGRALIRGHYHEKVLATQPIAYWPLWESAGTVAQCLVNPAQNGTYSSDVSTWPVGPGIGDGNSAPFFDGTNDYVTITSAALGAAFSISTGTIIQWAKVNAAGTWFDAAERYLIRLLDAADSDPLASMNKSNVNVTMRWLYRTGGVLEFLSTAGHNNTEFVCWGMTWSTPADELKAWKNAVQTGATQGTLGVAGGVINYATIGAFNQAPTLLWHGHIAHTILYDRVLPQPELRSLTVI